MPRTNRRGGHYPGHVRETFADAIEAYVRWQPNEPEPMVDFEVNYEARQIPISKACGLVWNCSDIMPSLLWSIVERTDLLEDVRHRTYGAVARAMHARIKG
jgi:hypothetical protein